MFDGSLVLRGWHELWLFAVLTIVLLTPLGMLLIGGTATAPIVALAASCLLLLFFAGMFMIGRIRAPAVISPFGLRLRTVAMTSYDTQVRWTQVDRIWLSRVGRLPCLLVLLHDPAATAGANRQVLRTMRANRRRYDADLLIGIAGVTPSHARIEAAVDYFSGGSRRLESVLSKG